MNRLIPVFLMLVVLASGCAGSAPAGAPLPAPGGSAEQPGPDPVQAQWAELTTRLRYKAGVYHDRRQGLFYITLYEPGARAEAEKVVADVAGLDPRSVVIQEAEFDRGQLNRWYDKLKQSGAWGEGVVTSSVDGSVNRIRFGVTTIESRQRLEAAIRQAGVPLDAVIIDLPEGALSEADPLKGCQVETLPVLDWEKPSQYHLRLVSHSLRPGQEFTITVAGAREWELTRGMDAYLECWDGSAWTPRYTLWSDRGDSSPAASIYSANRGIFTIGFDASRPGRFVLPEDLKSGWYRIRLHVSGTVDGRYQPYELRTLVQVGQ